MIAAVVMVGEQAGDDTPTPVAWVRQARRAAAHDLVEQLSRQRLLDQIVFVSPELHESNFTDSTHWVKSEPGPVHVGRQLAEVIQRLGIHRLLYFGGGSAPLLDDSTLSELIGRLLRCEAGVFTNNRYASDWAGVVPAQLISEWQDRLPLDNMLGWVLSAEAHLPADVQPPSAATRLDIDTPTDLLTLRLHPATKAHLHCLLSSLPLDTENLQKAIAVLRQPASHVFIAGRIGPTVWQALNQSTQCWVRIFSEERGMVSSGRLARGETFSFLAEYLSVVGAGRFFATLSKQAQAAFIDTRVLLAHHRRWPSQADRFASDLGLVEDIEDDWLQEFTAAAAAADVPVILGGHGLLSGDLLAICQLL